MNNNSGGSPANSGHTPYSNARDNSFYDLATASDFSIKFRRDAGSFRMDGINIQADVSTIDSSVVPEPVTLSLLVLGL